MVSTSIAGGNSRAFAGEQRTHKRVCFGGLQPAEVRELDATLDQVVGGWDRVFCENGEEVLQALESVQTAALVVDVHIDGNNSAALLQLAACRHPRTLRIALGAVSDRELLVNALGAPYQFISRPWKAPEMMSGIERALALDAWLSSDRLREFVPHLGLLPGLPATYFEVVKKAEAPDASIETVARVVARDPALMARLLQIVNSAASGLARKITSADEAVAALGLEGLKCLVLCLQVYHNSTGIKRSGLSIEALWSHSFAVARLAHRVAAGHWSDPAMASDAYAAGLLHGIGQVVLAANVPEDYALVTAAIRAGQRPEEAELERFGVTSNQVGAYLLGVWGLPLPLIEATALYSTPSLSCRREFSLVTAVHVASVLAVRTNRVSSDRSKPKLDVEYLRSLQLPDSIAGWRARLAGPARTESASQLGKPSGGSRRNLAPVRSWGIAVRAWKRKLLIAGALLLLCGVGLILFRPNHLEQAADLMRSGITFQKPKNPAPSSAFKLEGIFFRHQHPYAVINGKALAPGQSLNGLTIRSINASSVVLETDGEQRTLTLE